MEFYGMPWAAGHTHVPARSLVRSTPAQSSQKLTPTTRGLSPAAPPTPHERRSAAPHLLALRRGKGVIRQPHGRPLIMIPASLSHIVGGYSPLTAARASPALSPSSTTPSIIWRAPRLQTHFNHMAVRSTLDAKPCHFKNKRPLPGSLWPYWQLGHVNRRQPGCDKRACVRRSLHEIQRGGCSKDPWRPCLDCHLMIMTASRKCRTACMRRAARSASVRRAVIRLSCPQNVHGGPTCTWRGRNS